MYYGYYLLIYNLCTLYMYYRLRSIAYGLHNYIVPNDSDGSITLTAACRNTVDYIIL